MMISEFEQWLRSRTNQEKRPFHEETILAYSKAARALDAWMTEKKVDGDFTACDTAVLNRFFRDYNADHTRGGTNTKQRNLRHLFTWLESDYEHPHPYTDDLNRYAPSAGRPSTLSADFIRDLLAVTGGGHGKAFSDVRDHALIRVLTEGLRRTEVTEMRMTDLPLDLMSQRVIRVVPLKGARAEEAGRIVLVAPATARAVGAYLRARRYHRLADSPFVWLGLHSGGPLDGMGLYRMLRRRAQQAGYEPAVHPHMFRHTFASDWQMGRIASDATFPGKRDHASAGDANRGHHGNAVAYDGEPAGQDGRVNTDCIRSIDDVPDPVALGDGMLRLLQRQTAATRADAGYGELPR
jgi:integrase/recombinase XerD